MIIIHLNFFIFFTIFQLQMFGFNSQLYSNFSEAVYRSHGIVAISILLQVCIFNILSVKTFYIIAVYTLTYV